jgi:hypothetical protein
MLIQVMRRLEQPDAAADHAHDAWHMPGSG